MSYIKVDSLHKDEENPKYIQPGLTQDFSYFGPLNTVNIFVGANNSGKSRFLRTLLKTEQIILSSDVQLTQILSQTFNILETIINDQYGFTYDYSAFKFTSDIWREFVNKRGKYNFSDDNSINYFFRALGQLRTFQYKNEPINVVIDKTWLLSLKSNFDSYLQNNNEVDFIKALQPFRMHLKILDQYSKVNRSDRWFFSEMEFNLTGGKYKDSFKELYNNLISILNSGLLKIKKNHNVYIPILRSANRIYNTSEDTVIREDIFSKTVSINYKINLANPAVQIFSGLQLYDSIKRTRNGRVDQRENFEKFQNFLSIFFFQGSKVTIVAEESDNKTTDHIIIHIDKDKKDRSLHDLGDGIQSLIILMYPIFIAPDNAWIFIEEPEINLHPGFQRIFIEQIFKNDHIVGKSLTFCLTTHSNHLLDLSLELNDSISIFTFEKIYVDGEPKILIDNINGTSRNALKLLGVHNSSVFLANCSIWVEGVSDRFYIKAYLAAYAIKFPDKFKYKEDIHYAFFEYAGSNIIHYVFSEESDSEESNKIRAIFLSNKIFLIADSDEGKEVKHENLLNQSGANFHYERLEVREIENLLSPVQLKKYLPKICKGVARDSLESKNLVQADYTKKYLGSYLSKFQWNRPKGFISASGTLATDYKNKLSQAAYADMVWDEMSESAQKLTEKIYSFIQKSNYKQ